MVHIAVAVVFFIFIMIFRGLNVRAVIEKLFTIAGYNEGQLFGLYSFGLFTRYKVKDRFVPVVALLSPVLCYILSLNSVEWLSGYKFGFELLILNGALTFIGLFVVREKQIIK